MERVWATVMARRAWREKQRLAPPRIRLWDGDMTLRGELHGELGGSFKFLENETGTAELRISVHHYLAKWVMNHLGRAKRNVIVTIDKQAARWSGFMDNYEVVRERDGRAYVIVRFKHDFEQAKFIRVWPNPFACPPLLTGWGAGEGLITASRISVSESLGLPPALCRAGGGPSFND